MVPLSFPPSLAVAVAARQALLAMKPFRTAVDRAMQRPDPVPYVTDELANGFAYAVLRLVRALEAAGVDFKDRHAVRSLACELLDELARVDGERVVSVSVDQAERLKAAGGAVEGRA